MTDEEKKNVKEGHRLMGQGRERHDPEGTSADVLHVSVRRCFIPSDFNDELPLYLLDTGESILILFGQWVYDPHTLMVSEALFEEWNCEKTFFERFSLRYHRSNGQVFELKVEGSRFVEAQRLPAGLKFKRLAECLFIRKHGGDLVNDLNKAGLI